MMVANFTKPNMAKVGAEWPQIKGALLRAATLLQQFGYNERNLTANSVIIPLAHYLHYGAQRTLTLTPARRLLTDCNPAVGHPLANQGGIWGSGLDTMLTLIRDVLGAVTTSSFPVVAVEVISL